MNLNKLYNLFKLFLLTSIVMVIATNTHLISQSHMVENEKAPDKAHIKKFVNHQVNDRLKELRFGLGTPYSSSLSKKGFLTIRPPQYVIGNAAHSINRNLERIYDIIKQKQGSMHHHFKNILKTNPFINGKILISFNITPKGNVKNVSIINSTVNDQELEKLVLKTINTIQFKPILIMEGNVKVVALPLLFITG